MLHIIAKFKKFQEQWKIRGEMPCFEMARNPRRNFDTSTSIWSFTKVEVLTTVLWQPGAHLAVPKPSGRASRT